MPGRKTHFFMFLLKRAVSQWSSFTQSLTEGLCLSYRKLIFKHVSFMSVLYVSTLIFSYRLSKFGNLSYTEIYFCGVYCMWGRLQRKKHVVFYTVKLIKYTKKHVRRVALHLRCTYAKCCAVSLRVCSKLVNFLCESVFDGSCANMIPLPSW